MTYNNDPKMMDWINDVVIEIDKMVLVMILLVDCNCGCNAVENAGSIACGNNELWINADKNDVDVAGAKVCCKILKMVKIVIDNCKMVPLAYHCADERFK